MLLVATLVDRELASHKVVVPPLMGGRWRIWIALAGMLGAGCQPAAPVGGPSGSTTGTGKTATVATTAPKLRFDELAAVAALDLRYDNGSAAGVNAILESLGGGVAAFDYDRDGWCDLALPGGGELGDRVARGLPTRLVRRRGVDLAARVESLAGLAAPRHFSHGATTGDFDNDGFADLLVTGYGGLTLWRNLGDGTFVDVTGAAGLVDAKWSSSAAWCDLNGDGHSDLYIAHYVNWSFDNNPPCKGPSGQVDVCPPRSFDGLDDLVYFSEGDGTFRAAGPETGLTPQGKGLGVLVADFDGDGDSDVYVANDTVPNFFYVNDGKGRLEESGQATGMALDDMASANGSMGVAATDYDRDGALDVWVANYEDELLALYRNLKNGSFQHVSRRVGVGRLGTLYVGFGCVTGDFDLDGDEDFAVANGHVVHHPRNAPIRQEPLLLLNSGAGQFAREIPEGYFAQPHLGRGLATADLDRDGRLDLVFTNTREPVAALLNRSDTGNRGVRVRLVGRRGTREPVGASAVLSTSAGDLLRPVIGGGSYLSTSEPVLHWGLPAGGAIRELRVTWPGGAKQSWTAGKLEQAPRDAGGAIVLVEGMEE
jgi:enediyne biosynthesis protein E4